MHTIWRNVQVWLGENFSMQQEVLVTQKQMFWCCPQHDAATYSWLRVKTGSSSSTLTLCSICHRDLFINIAKAGRTENCRRRSMNGGPASVGMSGIHGMSRLFAASELCLYIASSDVEYDVPRAVTVTSDRI